MKTKYRKILIAADHAGAELKTHLLAKFPELPWQDLGTHGSASVDYPDYAGKLCRALEDELPESVGVLICGSGQGMAIQANRFPFIRCALAWNEDVAQKSRQHNDANVLSLAARLIEPALNENILTAFLTTEFEGGRHQARVAKLSASI